MARTKPSEVVPTYLAFDPDTRLFKIGYSEDVARRIRALQSRIPGIRLLTTWDERREKELHSRFGALRVSHPAMVKDGNGGYSEWFQLFSKESEFSMQKPTTKTNRIWIDTEPELEAEVRIQTFRDRTSIAKIGPEALRLWLASRQPKA